MSVFEKIVRDIEVKGERKEIKMDLLISY